MECLNSDCPVTPLREADPGLVPSTPNGRSCRRLEMDAAVASSSGRQESRLVSPFRCWKNRELGLRHTPSLRKHIRSLRCSAEHQYQTTNSLGIDSVPYVLKFGHGIASHICAVACEDGVVSLIDTTRDSSHFSRTAFRWRAHSNVVYDLAWSSEESRIATASGDQSVVVWDLARSCSTHRLRGHTGSIRCLNFQHSSPHVLVTASRDGHTMIWDLRMCTRVSEDDGKECTRPVSVLKSCHAGDKISHQPKRPRMSSSSDDGGHSVSAALFMADDMVVASAGSMDGRVKLWDLRRPVSAHTVPQPIWQSSDANPRGIAWIELDRSGRQMLVSGRDSRIEIWDTSRIGVAAMKSQALTGHHCGSFFVRASFNCDGSYVASGSSDGSAYLWELNANKSPLGLKGHKCEVSAVAWSTIDPDRLASCSDDRSVFVWSPSSGKDKQPGDGSAVDYADVYPEIPPSVFQYPLTPQSVSRESVRSLMEADRSRQTSEGEIRRTSSSGLQSRTLLDFGFARSPSSSSQQQSSGTENNAAASNSARTPSTQLRTICSPRASPSTPRRLLIRAISEIEGNSSQPQA